MKFERLGIIFDWDGVVLDSSSFHEESWKVLAMRHSLTLPEGHFNRGFGMRNETIIPEVLGWTANPNEIRQLAEEKEKIYRELLASNPIEPLPGVRELLLELKNNSIPTAVGSSTPRENLELALKLLNLESLFSATVSGSDVDRGKPFPDVFLKAASLIVRNPFECIVLEDAPVGIEAARQAGMRCVGVLTTNSSTALKNADLIVASLSHLSLNQLAQIRPMGNLSGSCQ